MGIDELTHVFGLGFLIGFGVSWMLGLVGYAIQQVLHLADIK